ncbi:hypothetical protein KAJ83_15870 [Marivibrio halodurans]|uniref:Alpha/beta hydrolase n=1 Tax=Marivibrio halodurans TaxID=2039722 RepID=A0A8J7V561_9PROT|nr:hypothetical protein [Marivibrio halodurans]MBP5858499.1 hypothetical protein [Marivibrio halodurans]
MTGIGTVLSRIVSILVVGTIGLAATGCSPTGMMTEAAGGMPAEIAGYPTVLHPDHRVATQDAVISQREREYLDEAVPLAFAVSEDGDFADWWRCGSAAKCDVTVESVVEDLIEYCERRVLGARCVLHSLGTRRIDPTLRDVDYAPIDFVRLASTVRHGPDEAKGLLVFLPGFSGWGKVANDRPRADADQGPPLLVVLNGRGWDVVRVNIPYSRRLVHWRNAGHWRALLESFVDRARAEGYDRVSFLGYSRGGAELLGALSAGAMVDGAAVIEPDRLGPTLSPTGDLAVSDARRREDLASLLSGHAGTPLLFAYFRESRWYGTMAPGMVKGMLAETGSMTRRRSVLIDAPNGFASHFAGYSDAFAAVYSSCFDRVLSGDKSGRMCERASPDRSRPPFWAVEADLRRAGLRALPPAELRARMSGTLYCAVDAATGERAEPIQCFTMRDGYLISSPRLDTKEPYLFAGEIEWRAQDACFHDFDNIERPRCLRFHEGQEGALWMVDGTTGHVFGAYATGEEDRMPPARWRCIVTRDDDGPVCEEMAPPSPAAF